MKSILFAVAILAATAPARAEAEVAPTVPAAYNAELCLKVNVDGALAATGKDTKAAALLLDVVCSEPVRKATLFEYNTALLAELGDRAAPVRVDPMTGELRLPGAAAPADQERLNALRQRAPAQLQTSPRLQALALQFARERTKGRR